MAKSSGGLEPVKQVNDLKIDFDGTTVLCRVCGDKASGFHYGVHSCEGCKGFFRRSIQQKIQYRPCTKNQQCAILRINRNRCQYCRLKKCIEVGMSRDAVRFGRVPKREKAKIMAEMQKQNAKNQASSLCAEMDDQESLLALIVKAHEETCEYTKPKITGILEQWRASNHLPELSSTVTCPLNPSSSSSSSSVKLHSSTTNTTTTTTSPCNSNPVDDFSDRFSIPIRGVVDFAKRLPGFLMIPQDDQVTLLKAGVFEILLVRLSRLFDSASNSLLCPSGQVLRRDLAALTGSNARFLVDSMFDFAERFNQMNLSDAEIAVFTAIILMTNDRPGLRSVELISKIQDAMKRCLERLLQRNHPDNLDFYAQLLRKIPDLRTLNTLHSEKLIGCKMEIVGNIPSLMGSLGVVSRSSQGRWAPRVSTESASPNSSFGRCGSSSPQSYSPTSVTSSETTRAADSGVESGSDCKFDLESDGKRRKISDSESQPLKSPDCDMPVLKRALQAPPLSNSSEIYAEIYRAHKKFRAATRKNDETRADSTTAPTHSPTPSPTDDNNAQCKEPMTPPKDSPKPSTRLHAALTQESAMPSLTMMPTHLLPGYGGFYGLGLPPGTGMMPAAVAAVAGSAMNKPTFPNFSFISPFYAAHTLHQQLGNINLYPQTMDMSIGYLPLAQSRLAPMQFPPLHQLHLETRSPTTTTINAPETSLNPRSTASTPNQNLAPQTHPLHTPLPSLKRPASAMATTCQDSEQPLNLSKKLDVMKPETAW